MFPTIPIPTPAITVPFPSADPYGGNVVSLLHFEQANGTPVPIDDIPGVVWGLFFSPVLSAVSTSDKKFGNAAWYRDSSINLVGGLQYQLSSIAASSTAWTVECFINYTAVNFFGPEDHRFLSVGDDFIGLSYNTVTGALMVKSATIAGFYEDTSGIITVGTFYHVAISCNGTNMRVFLNGVLVYTQVPVVVLNGMWYYPDSSGRFSSNWSGYIDEARLTIGAARYLSNFTPPAVPFSLAAGAVTQTSTPRPTPASPLPLSIFVLPTLYGVVGTLIASTTLATLTCTDLTATHSLSSSIPGLTVTLAWVGPSTGTLTIAGTPTGNSSFTRLVVTYLATDGVTVLGSSTHAITIQGTVTLTLSTLAPINGKVGVPINALALATMTSSAAIDAIAIIGESVPGLTPTFTWNRATNSGTLTVSGTPTQAGQFNLTMNYKANGALLNTGSHVAIIDAAYSAPSPAPAPAPAPAPPPAPTPPPAATPAPQPGSGQDPYWAFVRMLLHYDVLASGQSYDPTVAAAPGAGLNWAGAKTQTFSGYYASGPAAPLPQGGALSYGPAPSPDGAYWRSGANFGTAFDGYPVSNMRGVVSGCEGRDGNLTAETMVNMDTRCLNALMAGGGNDATVRYCPVISLLSSAGDLVWTLGFGSWLVGGKFLAFRVVVPCFYDTTAFQNFARTSTSDYQLLPDSSGNAPNRYIHFAACKRISFEGAGDMRSGVWFDGQPGRPGGIGQPGASSNSDNSIVQIGGSIPAMEYLLSYVAKVTQVPFSGGVDESRITAANRYDQYIAFNAVGPLPAYARVIPWLNS